MAENRDQSRRAPDPRDLFVDAAGVRLAVRDYRGAGRPLVFVHGGPGPNLTSWDAFARALAGPFRCVAYDQRGHGQSDQAADYTYAALTGDLRAIVDTLRLDEPVVVGHSWGGMIALMYAAAYPDACAGVVAVDGPLTGEDLSLSAEGWAWLEQELRTNPLLARTLGFVGTPQELEELLAWTREVAPPHGEPFSEAGFRRNLIVGPDGRLRSNHDAESLLALNRAVDAQGLPGLEVYGKICCPGLLVMATRGPFSREAVTRVQARYSGVRVAWLACGHLVQDERAEELAALITEFAASL